MTAYAPSPELTEALTAFNKAQEAADQAREVLRAAVAAELKSYKVTNDALAAHLPWSGATVRGIAREYDVPRKRQPTVRSIKPKKRAGGSTSG
jgi:plasmid stability protein